MEEERYLKEIKHEGEAIHQWSYVELKDHSVRVYFNIANEIGSGFVFYALENIGYVCVPETEKDIWHPEYAMVKCLYEGIAYFDGIRHLYMGSEFTDNYGYHYYANLEMNIETLRVIRELEVKYCRDH